MTRHSQQRGLNGLKVRIRVAAQLDAGWSDWFEGLEVKPLAGGVTRLSGTVADQASLHGLLARIRDLGVPLMSLEVTGTVGGSTATETPGQVLLEDGATAVGRPPIDNGR